MNVERHSLRRLVVEKQTGRFLTAVGEWTYNESDAMAFDDISLMLSKCAAYRVTDAWILLRFQNDERLDVKLPLPKEKEPPPPASPSQRIST